MINQKLVIGSRVFVRFKSSYYRGDGSSGYGSYMGYDKKLKKYKVLMEDKVGIPHQKIKKDKNTNRPYLSETHKTYENAVAYVDREQIEVVKKVSSAILINSKEDFEKIRPKLKVGNKLKFANDPSIWNVDDVYDTKDSWYFDLITSGDGWITLIINKKTNKVSFWEGF